MRRGTADPPTMDELRCLNSFPENTIGYDRDNRIIGLMLALCNDHGFGRMEQLMTAIHEIWRDPEKVQKWDDFRKEHMKFLADSAEHRINEDKS